MPTEAKQQTVVPSQVPIEVTGEHATLPQSVRELEHQGYVTTVTSTPTIAPGTQIQHVGPTVPVKTEQSGQTEGAQGSAEDRASLFHSRLWKNITFSPLEGPEIQGIWTQRQQALEQERMKGKP